MPIRRTGRAGMIGSAAPAPAPAPAPQSAPGAPVAQAAAGADVLGQLQQLAELKRSGLLSEEEFAAAKAKLLG